MKKAITALCCAVALAVFVAPGARADEYTKQTFLTFSGPVQVPGATLPAGTYMFKLADPESGRRAIQIWDKEGSDIIATLLTIPNQRMEPAAVDLVVREMEHAVRDALLADQHAAADLRASRGDLLLRRALVEQLHQLAANACEGLPALVGSHTHVDSQHARVAMELDGRIDRVGEPGLLANTLEQARAHSTTEQRVEHVECVARLVAVAEAAGTEREVELLEVAARDVPHGRREGRRRLAQGQRLPGRRREVLLDEFDQPVMIDGA